VVSSCGCLINGNILPFSSFPVFLSVILLFLLLRLSPNVGGAVDDGGRGKGAWGTDGARRRSDVLIGRPTVIVALPYDVPDWPVGVTKGTP
jgi:hypothetical protein